MNLQQNGIILNEAANSGTIIREIICVKILSYHKDVFARITYDGWISYQDHVAVQYLWDSDFGANYTLVPQIMRSIIHHTWNS